MMKRMVAVLAVGLLVGPGLADDAKKDQEKMAGEWTMESGERNGEKLPDEIVKTLKRVVKGNEHTVLRDGETVAKGKVKLDAAKKPKEIDISLSGGEADGKLIKGIYELDGDTLKICYGMPDGDRPKEFAAKEGS